MKLLKRSGITALMSPREIKSVLQARQRSQECTQFISHIAHIFQTFHSSGAGPGPARPGNVVHVNGTECCAPGIKQPGDAFSNGIVKLK